MLVLRLQRTGRKNIPAYRIVVAEKSAPVKGGVLEYIGHYLPARNPHEITFEKERIEYWISKGAKPSDTLARLLKREGMSGLEKFIKTYTKKKTKNAPEEVAAPAPKPAAEKKEEVKPVEEAKEPAQEPAKTDTPESDNAPKEE